MKILSKYKDYYDFLSGVYGEDPKLILDRRDFYYQKYRPSKGKITFIICGKIIEGYFDGENYHYGDSLKQFGEELKTKNFYYPDNKCVFISNKKKTYSREDYYCLDIREDLNNINKKENCPIILATGIRVDNFTKFPILSEFQLAKFIPAEEIYKWLSTWLANKIDEKQNYVDNRTDDLKLESNGFDKKISFRNIK
jgi:hypothetical protein